MRPRGEPEGVPFRANYATVYLGVQLGPEGYSLDLDWASAAGDETEAYEFAVPTSDPVEGLLGVQAFDVGEYGHEIHVNDETLGGFDIPPADGWQYWTDTITEAQLREGTNTLRVVRDTDTHDAFAVGNVFVHWKEPLPDES
jgi:hypothetical protein